MNEKPDDLIEEINQLLQAHDKNQAQDDDVSDTHESLSDDFSDEQKINRDTVRFFDEFGDFWADAYIKAQEQTHDKESDCRVLGFGKYLRWLRESAELTIAELSKKSQVPESEILAYERGLLPKTCMHEASLRALATALDEDVDNLLLLLHADMSSEQDQINLTKPNTTNTGGMSGNFSSPFFVLSRGMFISATVLPSIALLLTLIGLVVFWQSGSGNIEANELVVNSIDAGSITVDKLHVRGTDSMNGWIGAAPSLSLESAQQVSMSRSNPDEPLVESFPAHSEDRGMTASGQARSGVNGEETGVAQRNSAAIFVVNPSLEVTPASVATPEATFVVKPGPIAVSRINPDSQLPPNLFLEMAKQLMRGLDIASVPNINQVNVSTSGVAVFSTPAPTRQESVLILEPTLESPAAMATHFKHISDAAFWPLQGQAMGMASELDFDHMIQEGDNPWCIAEGYYKNGELNQLICLYNFGDPTCSVVLKTGSPLKIPTYRAADVLRKEMEATFEPFPTDLYNSFLTHSQAVNRSARRGDDYFCQDGDWEKYQGVRASGATAWVMTSNNFNSP